MLCSSAYISSSCSHPSLFKLALFVILSSLFHSFDCACLDRKTHCQAGGQLSSIVAHSWTRNSDYDYVNEHQHEDERVVHCSSKGTSDSVPIEQSLFTPQSRSRQSTASRTQSISQPQFDHSPYDENDSNNMTTSQPERELTDAHSSDNMNDDLSPRSFNR